MTKSTWEEEFEDRFPFWKPGQECMQELPAKYNIKEFIVELLSQQVREIVDEIPDGYDVYGVYTEAKQQLKLKYGIK